MKNQRAVSHHSFLLFLFVITIVYFIVEFRLLDQQMEKHQELEVFMNQGGRNTSDMGYRLCMRVKDLEDTHEPPITYAETCQDIYLVPHEVENKLPD